jgi:hypothetical protein
MIAGRAAGSMILKKISLSRAPKERAISSRTVSTCLTPVMVLMMMTNMAKRKTTAMRDSIPSPNHRMSTGTNAVVGADMRAFT